ncbi:MULTISPECIES: alpha-amylase family glycosyl hydrolase [unclassified Spirosoma]|uniref:alpha-amylase family glycosyl hydrolase n=1 Tax=unclassified Spirosoma TaxID=2621999 RepID=UPI000AB4DBED|nr:MULTISPECIES: alpha-amylase family glycosyl hydrolase [unclassified Spirosoma]MBN8820878.1 alpha-amylase [Spirosoma sp.]
MNRLASFTSTPITGDRHGRLASPEFYRNSREQIFHSLPTLRSVQDIQLEPKPGKRYWPNCHREWREEFIYFILIDRFHDSLLRHAPDQKERTHGFGTAENLGNFCGGTFEGIIQHLDYVRTLGCTALWLSPVLENNLTAYHGYATQNYLAVDPRFGTQNELEHLVEAAHQLDMRVFLDIVLHHSGDNWFYPDDEPFYHYRGVRFPFGDWRWNDRPLPVELRNPDMYNRQGRIRNFDAYPETLEGDFFGLKAFRNDASPEAADVLDVLTKVYCYWMQELDIDGFRIDAVKHLRPEAIHYFCNRVREYAYRLGKKNFFIFGELVGSDHLCTDYIGPYKSTSTVDVNIYYGLDSVLDFPLYNILEGVIKGVASPTRLIERYAELQDQALHRHPLGEYLVTFLDNHDQIGQSVKQRFGYGATDKQIIAGVGYLLCALGTPCLYYGTEQGFDGSGADDRWVRECMFNPEDLGVNAFNQNCTIYQAIAQLACIRRKTPALKFGRMYWREISLDGQLFYLPTEPGSLLAFCRMLHDTEVLIVYNSSCSEIQTGYVIVDAELHKRANSFFFLYGSSGEAPLLGGLDSSMPRCVQVQLLPTQLVILSAG